MASVLVDPDDLSYMDGVDDDDDLSEVGSDKRQKKRKNRIIHEALSINSKQPLVQELRQDRKRLLSEMEVNNKDKEPSSGISMLHELRKDRKQALEDQRASSDTPDGLTTSNLGISVPQCTSISELKPKLFKQEKIQSPKQAIEVEVITGSNILLKQNSIDDTETPTKTKTLHTDTRIEQNTMKQQVEEDLKNLHTTLQETSRKDNKKEHKHDESCHDDITEIEEGITDQYVNKDIVEPRVITEAQILMTDEPSTSGAVLDDFQTPSKSKLKKKKSDYQDQNSKKKPDASRIQIIVTKPQDESDTGSLKKINGNVHGKGKGKKKDKSDQYSTSPEVTDEDSSGLSGIASLNYLRRLSSNKSEGEGAANDLLIKRALYEQGKTKPFKRMAKLKSGEIEVGIEGDLKRSYIKALTLMPDKKLVMFDRNNQCLKLFDADFNPLDRVCVHVKFCGLTPVFDETLVVSFPEKKQLQLYHIDRATSSFQQERTQTTAGEYYAIAHFEIKLYMLQRQRTHDRFKDDKWSVQQMDLNMGDEEPVVLRRFSPGHKDNNLYVNAQGVYLTNKLEGEVLLMDHDGAIKQRCSVNMSLPMCITSDGQGNIFVCGGAINSFIEVFKSNLEGSKVIFNKKAQDLVAMCYDKQNNYLYVSDKIAGKVLRYKIEHNGLMHGLMRAIVAGSGISC